MITWMAGMVNGTKFTKAIVHGWRLKVAMQMITWMEKWPMIQMDGGWYRVVVGEGGMVGMVPWMTSWIMDSELGDAMDGCQSWLTKVELSAMLGGAIDDTLDGAMDGGWYRGVVGKGDMVGRRGGAMDGKLDGRQA